MLVFDDNEAVRETTAEVLVAAGFKVKEARCPDEVVRLLAEADICVVLLDVGLEHQGLAILDRVDDPPPVILMSGDSRDPEDPRASVFLPKPIPVYRLIEEVARHAVKARKPSVRHEMADRQTTRSGAGTWSGFLACTCGWFAEVFGWPSRESAAISLQATWLSHSSD
ncbi:MAG TPA: response regulator [Acidimicrobiales bacterium]|nr:response regulator [Acidimicrobiales bacterium]